MKKIPSFVYEAFDGSTHQTEATCEEHEEKFFFARFVGLPEERVLAALDRRGDLELADAFETAGQRIAKIRRERDKEMRRAAKEPAPPALPENAPVGEENAE